MNLINIFDEISLAMRWTDIPKSIWTNQLNTEELLSYKLIVDIFNTELKIIVGELV